jgi:hypothetical protein
MTAKVNLNSCFIAAAVEQVNVYRTNHKVPELNNIDPPDETYEGREYTISMRRSATALQNLLDAEEGCPATFAGTAEGKDYKDIAGDDLVATTKDNECYDLVYELTDKDTDHAAIAKAMTASWYEQKVDYDFATGKTKNDKEYTDVAGLTAMLWKGAKEVP